MKLLIIGGTMFLGRHIVDIARSEGHEITLFNRGMHNADLFPDVERITGDRRGDLSALEGRTWDAVIDTCGYFPADVRRMASTLAGSVDHYTFVSSLSVYADNSTPGQDESGAVATTDTPDTDQITNETYGPLKALCEAAAEEAMPGRVCNVRAGLIVGPWDPTDRFTYWPHRIDQGGEVLAPGDPEMPVQFIDVRDLASWILLMAGERRAGVFNATGPDHLLTMRELLDDCREAAGNEATLTWVSEEFLIEKEVGPWMEMPLWIPNDPEMAGFSRTSNDRAIENGLRFRSNIETVRDTLAWDRTLPEGRELRAGITRERERELLEAWHASKS